MAGTSLMQVQQLQEYILPNITNAPHIIRLRISPPLSRPFQPTPLGTNVHLPILINHLSPVPLTPFALLCPSYILFCLLAAFLPLLYLLICEASRAKPI